VPPFDASSVSVRLRPIGLRLASPASICGPMILTGTPASRAMRTMWSVPGDAPASLKAYTASIPEASISLFLIGPAALPCLAQSAG